MKKCQKIKQAFFEKLTFGILIIVTGLGQLFIFKKSDVLAMYGSKVVRFLNKIKKKKLTETIIV